MTQETDGMAELSGLAAVVTGGGSGIGLATARLLASRGARVAVLDLKPGEEFLGLSRRRHRRRVGTAGRRRRRRTASAASTSW